MIRWCLPFNTSTSTWYSAPSYSRILRRTKHITDPLVYLRLLCSLPFNNYHRPNTSHIHWFIWGYCVLFHSTTATDQTHHISTGLSEVTVLSSILQLPQTKHTTDPLVYLRLLCSLPFNNYHRPNTSHIHWFIWGYCVLFHSTTATDQTHHISTGLSEVTVFSSILQLRQTKHTTDPLVYLRLLCSLPFYNYHRPNTSHIHWFIWGYCVLFHSTTTTDQTHHRSTGLSEVTVFSSILQLRQTKHTTYPLVYLRLLCSLPFNNYHRPNTSHIHWFIWGYCVLFHSTTTTDQTHHRSTGLSEVTVFSSILQLSQTKHTTYPLVYLRLLCSLPFNNYHRPNTPQIHWFIWGSWVLFHSTTTTDQTHHRSTGLSEVTVFSSILQLSQTKHITYPLVYLRLLCSLPFNNYHRPNTSHIHWFIWGYCVLFHSTTITDQTHHRSTGLSEVTVFSSIQQLSQTKHITYPLVYLRLLCSLPFNNYHRPNTPHIHWFIWGYCVLFHSTTITDQTHHISTGLSEVTVFSSILQLRQTKHTTDPLVYLRFLGSLLFNKYLRPNTSHIHWFIWGYCVFLCHSTTITDQTHHRSTGLSEVTVFFSAIQQLSQTKHTTYPLVYLRLLCFSLPFNNYHRPNTPQIHWFIWGYCVFLFHSTTTTDQTHHRSTGLSEVTVFFSSIQ